MKTGTSPLKNSLLALTFTVTCIAFASTSAQEVDGQNNGSGEDGGRVFAPEDANYLERFTAIERVQELQDVTLNDIHRLKILVNNFGGEVSEAQGDYEKVKEKYRSAQIQWYRRRYRTAQIEHEECRDMIKNLYKKFSDQFQAQTMELLDESSALMVDTEFSVSLEPGQATSNNHRTIMTNSVKLRIAYQQTAMAEDMLRDNRPSAAINHYRIAKVFAIDVLRGLQSEESQQADIEDRYRVHLIDARGAAVQPSN